MNSGGRGLWGAPGAGGSSRIWGRGTLEKLEGLCGGWREQGRVDSREIMGVMEGYWWW